MAKKVIRKKISIGTDEFITSRSKVFKYLSENFKIVATATSVVAVLLLSYAGWSIYSSQRDKKAADALHSAMKVYQAKIDAAGASPDTFKTADERYRASISKFMDLSKKYKGSNVGAISLLYAANSHYNLKEFDKAIELYNRLLFKIEREDPSLHGNINEIKVSSGIVRDTAIYGLASSYEQKGDLKKAIEIQTLLTSSKDSHLREEALITIGRLFEKNNDKAKALESYQKAITDYPESSNLSRIKEKVERLKS